MDVRCERCGTEYDFDDALVSERGTTVRCTNCGHQFKVFPMRTGGHPERWVVRTAAGRELVYTSLRDLQKGIAEGQVGPDDQLSRGGQPQRLLGAIAELEPFFLRSLPEPTQASRPVGNGERNRAAPPAEHAADGGSGASRAVGGMDPQAVRARVATIPRVPLASDAALGMGRVDGERGRGGFEETLSHGSPDSDPPTAPRNSPADELMGPDEPTPESTRVKPRPVAPGLLQRAEISPMAVATAGGAGPDYEAPEREFPERGDTVPLPPVEPLEPAPTKGGADRSTEPSPGAGPGADLPSPARDSQAHDSDRPGGTSSRPPQGAKNRRQSPRPAVSSPSAGVFVPVPNPPGRFGESRRSRISLEPDSGELFSSPVSGAGRQGSSLSDPDYRFVPPSRAGVMRTRWVIAWVLAGLLVLVGGTVGVPWVLSLAGSKSEAPPPDPRTKTLVELGNRAIGDGDLEAAREQIAKASLLAEADPSVLAAQARLETVRADLAWLRLKLLDPRDRELVRASKKALGSLTDKARLALEPAARIAPDHPVVIRSQIDFWRIAGDVTRARSLVERLAGRTSDPASVYSLAVLDLAEPSPKYKAIIDRLQGAALEEGELGLAAGTLIYAMGVSGALESARAELRTVAERQRPHVLLGELQAFLRRVEAASPASVASSSAGAAAGPGPSSRLREGERSEADEAWIRNQLWLGKQALKTQQTDRAARYFAAVLEKHPRHFEAQAGLAEAKRLLAGRGSNDPGAGAAEGSTTKRTGPASVTSARAAMPPVSAPSAAAPPMAPPPATGGAERP